MIWLYILVGLLTLLVIWQHFRIVSLAHHLNVLIYVVQEMAGNALKGYDFHPIYKDEEGAKDAVNRSKLN